MEAKKSFTTGIKSSFESIKSLFKKGDKNDKK